MMKKNQFSNEGFTLIELLIVIVIIGILAGVVIGVLNPIQQQNRARDATYRSSLNKMALAAKSLYVSSPRSTQRSPTLAEFAGGVGNIVDSDNDCTVGANANNVGYTGNCLFTVDGLTLPSDCSATPGYNNTGGGTPCQFVYWRNADSFRIGVRGAANPPQLFIFEYVEAPGSGNVQEGFYTCANNLAINASLGSCTKLN